MAALKEGSIVHVEIHSGDVERTKRFYGDVFGWKFQDIPEMNYSLWTAPGEPAGGLQKHGDKGPMVLDYIYANDIDATLAKIAASGGRVLSPKSEIQGQGWWALFQEPGGNVMALYEALRKAPPPRRSSAPRKAAGKKAGRKASKGRRKK